MVHVPLLPDPAARFAFDPAAPRARRDGWTEDAQRAFIAALVAGDSIAAACRLVGRSPQSAYALRRRADAAGFAAAWDAALADAITVTESHALEACLTPTVVPIWYYGRQVGERVRHNERLMMRILRRAAPRERPADPAMAYFEAMARFQAGSAARAAHEAQPDATIEP